MSKNMKTGQAGVLRVMSELLLLDYSPYQPTVDDHGVDIMLSDGVRIQVKTARLGWANNTFSYKGQPRKSSRQVYRINFGTLSAREDSRAKTVRRAKQCSEECEFVIMFGVDESRFWIVPSFLLDGCLGGQIPRGQLFLGPKSLPNTDQVRLLASQGKGLQEIASILDICTTTAWSYKKRNVKKGNFARSIRMCEGRWDFLKNRPINRIEALALIEHDAEVEDIQQLERMLQK